VVRNRCIATIALALAVVTLGAACGGKDDDGAGVRDCSTASGSASGTASGSASASGSGGSGSTGCSGSGSGIADQVKGSSTDNAQVKAALAAYGTWARSQVDDTIAKTGAFTDAVRAGDVAAAKAAYAPSRQGWERIEPVASLVPEIDGAVDARVDDFKGVDDPEFTGWHRLEYLLWEKNTTAGATPFADRLDKDLQTLKTELAGLEIPPAALAVGSSELIEEVSSGKITGEEDRYSHTDLWDFAANVEGSEKGFDLLEPALEAKDAKLAGEIEALFTKLDGQIAAYRDGPGYKPYSALTDADKAQMKTTLAALSEKLADVAGTLGLKG
jgi:iron uptake system component EfeO